MRFLRHWRLFACSFFSSICIPKVDARSCEAMRRHADRRAVEPARNANRTTTSSWADTFRFPRDQNWLTSIHLRVFGSCIFILTVVILIAAALQGSYSSRFSSDISGIFGNLARKTITFRCSIDDSPTAIRTAPWRPRTHHGWRIFYDDRPIGAAKPTIDPANRPSAYAHLKGYLAM